MEAKIDALKTMNWAVAMWFMSHRHFDPDDFIDQADPDRLDWFGRWVGGVLVPACLAWYAVTCLWRQETFFVGLRDSMFVEGWDAIIVGCGYLCIAAFMHLHLFWSYHPRYWGYAQLGKLLSGIALIGCCLTLVVRFFQA